MTYAEAMGRYGSDKPDLRFAIELTDLHRLLRRAPGSGSSRTPTSAPSSWPAARARPGASSTPGRSGPSSAAPAGWPTCWSARTARWTSAVRWSRTCPRPSGPGSPRPSAPARATASSSPRARRTTPARCSAPPASRSPDARRAARRVGVVVRLDRRRADVRAVADTDDVAVGHGRGPRVHHAFTSPNAELDRPVRGRPGERARLRLRHRLQRQRDRRRVDPYPPRATCRSGSSR